LHWIWVWVKGKYGFGGPSLTIKKREALQKSLG
jgi:hypothetical protein